MATLIKDPSQIKSLKVRLILSTGNIILDKDEALSRALTEGLDLVLVQDGDIPVVKFCDFSKLEYEKQKQTKANKPRKPKQVQIGPHTQEHDLVRFAGQAQQFIEEGHPVSLKVEVRGRDRQFETLIREKIDHFVSLVKGAKPGKVSKSENGSVYVITLT